MARPELPHCSELEQRVIACIYSWDDEALPIALNFIGESSECFYDHRHRTIYDAMIAMHKNGDLIRPESLIAHLELMNKLSDAGGESYINDSIVGATTSNYIETYAKTIHECHRRRQLILACRNAEQKLSDLHIPLQRTTDKLESEVFKSASINSKSKPEKISDLSKRERSRLQKTISGEMSGGIKTGFDVLDRILLPMRGGDYIILAATTSTGKTTLACNIAMNVAHQGHGVLIFSMEMTKLAIANKLLGMEAGVDLVSAERSQKLPFGAEKKIEDADAEMEKLNIIVDDECGITPTRLRTKARGMLAKEKIDLIVVDYLGRMHVAGMESDPTNTISIISGEIKDMAKELNVPVLCLCQVNRGGAEGKPELRHLRQSGSLEQDCDVAILLSRCANPLYINAEIAKQRTGPIGEAVLFFKKDTQRFLDTDHKGNPIWPEEKGEEKDPFPENSYFEDDDTPF